MKRLLFIICAAASAVSAFADVTIENSRMKLTVGDAAADVTLHARGMAYFVTSLPKDEVVKAFGNVR